jgi:hypothetical protein
MDATMTTDKGAAEFLVKNAGPISDLIRGIKNDVATKLPCLGIESKVDGSLPTLVRKAVYAYYEGGEECTGAVEFDSMFTVTVDKNEKGEIKLTASLNLATTIISA